MHFCRTCKHAASLPYVSINVLLNFLEEKTLTGRFCRHTVFLLYVSLNEFLNCLAEKMLHYKFHKHIVSPLCVFVTVSQNYQLQVKLCSTICRYNIFCHFGTSSLQLHFLAEVGYCIYCNRMFTLQCLLSKKFFM